MANEITVGDFTTETLDGTGVFDVMMRSVQAHVVNEGQSGRITGTEYANVYLGSLQTAMTHGMELLFGKDKLTLELQMLEIQRDRAQIEKETAEVQQALMQAQVSKIGVEMELAELEKLKITADTARIDAQSALLARQEANGEKEGLVLDAQACKLKAEYDLILQQVAKAAEETGLLAQKTVSEQAQTQNVADETSVIGRQLNLYQAQADGFQRNAEQKAAKIMVDTWNVRRTTDEGTIAGKAPQGDDNKLGDANIAKAVGKLLSGVNAT